IALRMKRETPAEYAGALGALRDSVAYVAADVPDLVELGEPYDGYVRHLPAAPLLPAVLAACGVPTVLHGCRELPPKRGVTANRVLAELGADVRLSVADAAHAVAARSWAYV